MNNKTNNALKLAIITMCFIQMGTNGIAPIMSDIAQAFPDASSTRVQFLMTLPNIVVVVVSLLTAVLVSRISEKNLIIFGLVSFSMAGAGAFLFHQSLNMLRFWAILIGIGIGLIASVSTVIINGRFEGADRRAMLGLQNSSANIGSMFMTFAGGFLASLGWHFGYLVFLIGIPGIIFTQIGVNETPKAKTEEKNEKTPLRITVIKEMMTLFFFMMFYVSVPSNIAMHVVQKGLGTASLAGTLSTLLLLGGTAGGIVYGRIAMKMGKKTVPMGAAFVAAGAALIAFSDSTLLLGLGCFISGSAISFVAPTCMSQATNMKGHETLAVSLMMATANTGAFFAPLMTSLSARFTGSDSTSYRFVIVAAGAVLLSVITFMAFREKKEI